jgi:hypothetical protein
MWDGSTMSSRVADFKQSVAPDHYAPTDLIDWFSVNQRMAQLQPGLGALQLVADGGDLSPESLGPALLNQPQILNVLLMLFAASGGVGFADGRELSDRSPVDDKDAESLARLITDLGLNIILADRPDVTALARIAAIAEDSERRRFRVRAKLEQQVRALVYDAVAQAQSQTSLNLVPLPESAFPPIAKRKVEYVIAVEGVPAIAIATVFQEHRGGRQQRDLELTYPTLQDNLSKANIALILIADGRGIREAPDRVLEVMFDRIPRCMTLRQASDGSLRDAFVELSTAPLLRSPDRTPLFRVIEASLEERHTIDAGELPADLDSARLALATYVTEHPHYAITLSAAGHVLAWERGEIVNQFVSLSRHFDPCRALESLAKLLNAGIRVTEPTANDALGTLALLELSQDLILPRVMVVAARGMRPESRTFRELAKRALHDAPDARVAILVTQEPLSAAEVDELRQTQSHRPVSTIVVDVASLAQIAKERTSARDAIVSHILAQSDLAKVSPFVLRSTTPERMFYGRRAEENTLLSAMPTHSVALLGGRRIGKTSLLRHVMTRLHEADFNPLFVDCQTVRTWNDFARAAARAWNVPVPQEFRPDHLIDLCETLTKSAGRRTVVLMDEVDQLLAWDGSHSGDDVPEAFFRACRAVSQSGIAQFVFSGERTIARKIWDPHSPHWNFCRPLALRQLTNDESRRLLIEPLVALQLTIDDEDAFWAAAWQRTSGHPQIIQFLGDRLVQRLNERPNRTDTTLTKADVISVTECYDFAEHYLETYWGQATRLERLISLFLSQGPSMPTAAMTFLEERGISASWDTVVDAFRMLELYGIIDRIDDGYGRKAEWFPLALSLYSSVDEMIDRVANEIAA